MSNRLIARVEYEISCRKCGASATLRVTEEELNAYMLANPFWPFHKYINGTRSYETACSNCSGTDCIEIEEAY